VTYEQLLKLAYQKTRAKLKEDEAAKLLLMELSGQDPHQFFLNHKSLVPAGFADFYMEKLMLYVDQHVPVQHIIGHAYFYGYKFLVNPDVLIPRSETEQLVEHVLFHYDTFFENQNVRVLDLGTGSGCIGLTLALEEKNMDVTISDISEKALEVASKNQKALGAHAHLILSDLFEHIEGTFDIIVSNPPYIPDTEVVSDIVEKEPSVALYGGSLGVDFYDKILEYSKSYLKDRGLIAFEHGYQQKDVIGSFALKHYPHANIVQQKDLSGKDRFTFIGTMDVLKSSTL
jgi:release factor glutamine methyltransferase